MKAVVEDWLADTVLPWPEAKGPWEVALHWAPGESGVVCTGFDVRLRDGADVHPMTASRLRELRLHELVQAGRRLKYERVGGDMVETYDALRAEGREHELDVSPGLVENLRRQADDWVEPERGQRLDDEHYRTVAVVYSSALAAGRNPLRAVIEEAPWSPTTKPTASRWVARARELGYLPPTDRGRARGNAELVHSAEAAQ